MVLVIFSLGPILVVIQNGLQEMDRFERGVFRFGAKKTLLESYKFGPARVWFPDKKRKLTSYIGR
jgi:hypothetical protein